MARRFYVELQFDADDSETEESVDDLIMQLLRDTFEADRIILDVTEEDLG